jgi:hypothetical protein
MCNYAMHRRTKERADAQTGWLGCYYSVGSICWPKFCFALLSNLWERESGTAIGRDIWSKASIQEHR